MTIQHLKQQAIQLESDIAKAKPNDRLRLQPELHKVLRALRNRGEKVPQRLRQLDLDLTEEAIEAQFDNLPV